MRVYQVNTFCGTKSTGRITTAIASLVIEEGGESRIAYGVPPVARQWKEIAYQVGRPLERKIHGAIRKFLDGEGYGSKFATMKLIEDIEKFNPDIIHLHNIHGCYIHLKTLMRYLKRKQLPIVWTLHDCWTFTGHCAYFDMSCCEKWRNGCHHCPSQRSYPVNRGIDGSKRNYREKKKLFSDLENVTLVTPSEWLEKLIKQSYMKKHKTKVIVNGVDVNVFKGNIERVNYSKYSLSESKKLVLAIASDWDERKGLDYIIKAFEALRQTHNFVVIGLSQSQVENLPKGMVGIQCTENVDELACWYSSADCLANPTLEDNMPMVNLESMACGTPVVVFDTGGCSEVVISNCGKVVKKRDTGAFIQAIEEVSGNKEKYRKFCLEQGLKYSEENTFKSYLDLYHTSINFN